MYEDFYLLFCYTGLQLEYKSCSEYFAGIRKSYMYFAACILWGSYDRLFSCKKQVGEKNKENSVSAVVQYVNSSFIYCVFPCPEL